MNQEMFTQLLEMAAAAGEGGFVLIVLYMILPTIMWFLIAGVVVYVSRMITLAVAADSRESATLKSIAILVGQPYTCGVSETEARRLIATIEHKVRTVTKE